MSGFREYIYKQVETVLKKEGGKLYFLTGFTPETLLVLKSLCDKSSYFKDAGWRVILLCPPELGYEFLLKRLPEDYVEQACSPDYAARFRDTEKVLFMYPAMISELISETLSLNTALDLGSLDLSLDACLKNHIELLFNEKKWDDALLCFVREIINMTAPPPSNEQEYEIYYESLIKALDCNEIHDFVRELLTVCGMLPDAALKDLTLHFNPRTLKAFKKAVDINIQTYRELLQEWSRDRKSLLDKLSDFDEGLTERLKEYLSAKSASDLVPHERALLSKVKLIKGWPVEVTVRFLRSEGEDLLTIDSILIQNELEHLWGRVYICGSKTKMLVKFRGIGGPATANAKGVVIFRVNGAHLERKSVVDDQQHEITFKDIPQNNLKSLNSPPLSQANYDFDTATNELSVRFEHQDEEIISFLFMSGTEEYFLIEIEPERILAIDVNEWKGRVVDIPVTDISPISWKSYYKTNRVEILRSETGQNVTTEHSIEITIGDGSNIVINRIKQSATEALENQIKCKRVRSSFDAKLNYLHDLENKRETIRSLRNEDFKYKKHASTFNLWLEGFPRTKYGPKADFNLEKYGEWLEQLVDMKEASGFIDLLPVGRLKGAEQLYKIRPKELAWNEAINIIKRLNSFNTFIESRAKYIHAFKLRIKDYYARNKSCKFCDFVALKTEIENYSKAYLSLMQEAITHSEGVFKSHIALFHCMDAVIEFDNVRLSSAEELQPTINELNTARVYLGPTHPTRALWSLMKDEYLGVIIDRLLSNPASGCSERMDFFGVEEALDGYGYPQHLILMDNTNRMKVFINTASYDGGAWIRYSAEDRICETAAEDVSLNNGKGEMALSSNEMAYAIAKYQEAYPFRYNHKIHLARAGRAGHLLAGLQLLHERMLNPHSYQIYFQAKYTDKKNHFAMLSDDERQKIPQHIEINYLDEDDPKRTHVLFSNTERQNLTCGVSDFLDRGRAHEVVAGCVTWKYINLILENRKQGHIDISRPFSSGDKRGPHASLMGEMLNLLQAAVLDPREERRIDTGAQQCRSQRVTLDKSFFDKIEREHNIADWVFSHESNIDIEVFDLKDHPYVVDHDKGVIVTSKDHGGVVRSYVRKGLISSGCAIEGINDDVINQVFDDINKFSGRSLINVVNRKTQLQGVIGLGLARRWLERQGFLPLEYDHREINRIAVMISIDDEYANWRNLEKSYQYYKTDIGEEPKDVGDGMRGDFLLCTVYKNGAKYAIEFEAVEVKNRLAGLNMDWAKQVERSFSMIDGIYGLTKSEEIADIEIARYRMAVLLDFHFRRRIRQVFQLDQPKILLGTRFRENLMRSICAGDFDVNIPTDANQKRVGKILHFDVSHNDAKKEILRGVSDYYTEYFRINTLTTLGLNAAHTQPELKPEKAEVANDKSKDEESSIPHAVLPINFEDGSLKWVNREIGNLLNGMAQVDIKDPKLESELEDTRENIMQVLQYMKIPAEFGECSITPNAFRILLKGRIEYETRHFENLKDKFKMVKGLYLDRVEPVPYHMALYFRRNRRGMVNYLNCLRERCVSKGFGNTQIILGRNEQAGELVYWDISTVPHALIGGSTGSGKTQLLAAIIMDLVLTNSPDELELILIDPKMVSFQKFQTLPHVRQSIIRDQALAVNALNGLLIEMDQRYSVLETSRVDDISKYNELHADPAKRMRRKIMIFDEFADWMLDDGFRTSVSTAVQRLSQKARAAGIHLVVSTQRPDNTVVPNILRANLGAKIALKVDREANSRIILDQPGAEKLLGKGHMIFMPSYEPVFAQGAYISDEAITEIVSGLKRIYGVKA